MNKVIYKGIVCTLYHNYFQKGDKPLIKINHSKDIDAAYNLGFECIGYPDEIVKYLSEEEYMQLSERGEI